MTTGEKRIRLAVEFELSHLAAAKAADQFRLPLKRMTARTPGTSCIVCPACEVEWPCRTRHIPGRHGHRGYLETLADRARGA